MDSDAFIAWALAAAFLSGSIDIAELVDRCASLLGRRWRWLPPLARRVCKAFASRTRPRQIAVARFLLNDDGFKIACRKHALQVKRRLAAPAAMSPVAAAAIWTVPSICTSGELAERLGIAIGELDWFADRRGLESKQNQGRLRHYHYRVLAKRFGRVRLIEAPKPRLKEIQRRILTEILDHVPVHVAAHGFRRGRSIATFAALHVGKRVVLRLDLEDFFPSISLARVQALFRTVGYPERVADLLAGLSSNSAPDDVWSELSVLSAETQVREARWLYAAPHLPQGAPTSPALANLCAYRLDCRLAALARSAGAEYTRYADDLAFSGGREFERVVRRFSLHVCATVMEEGFSVHHRKTRIMRHGARQHLAGLVVNRRLNVLRTDYDRLKAILTNCLRHGADSQNRAAIPDFRAHLLGRLSFVDMLNPARGARLRALYEQINW
jgi:hypothetical protein